MPGYLGGVVSGQLSRAPWLWGTHGLCPELQTEGCPGVGAGLGCRGEGEGPTPGSSFVLHFLLCRLQWK